MQSDQSKVESLEIDASGISKSASQNLFTSICAMPRLKNVKLSGNVSDGFYCALKERASSLKVESLQIDTEGISESSSHILGACICTGTMTYLKDVKLRGQLSDEFYNALREGASSLKVESLELRLQDINILGQQSLCASICAMLCLRSVKIHSPSVGAVAKITLRKNVHVGRSSSSDVISSSCQINFSMDGEQVIGFVASLPSSQTSSAQVESLQINGCNITESASQTLGVSICAMSYLKDVKLSGDLSDGFYYALREGASSMKVESLELRVNDISVDGLQSLSASMCALPCLRSVNIQSSDYNAAAAATITLIKNVGGLSSSEVISSSCQINISMDGEQVIAFVALLSSSQTSSAQVESLQIDYYGISESASQTLGACICAMTCLQDVKLRGKLSDGFYSALRKGASSLKVESLHIDDHGISESASQSLGASICAMPFLQHVKLSGNLSDGFYNVLREGASSLKIESLQIDDNDISESASQTLGSCICAMEYLKDVKLRGNLSNGFYSELREGTSSLKIRQMHLMGATLDRRHLSTIALMSGLKSLTLFDINTDDRNHTEMDGSDPPSIHSSTSLTELNVDHDTFISLHRIGLLKRFPGIQKMTLAFSGETPFPQDLLHHVTMPDVTDLSLHGFYWDGPAEIVMLSLEPFPNLIKLSLINIIIRNANCTIILDSLRNNETLKTISIKHCLTDAGLDPLVDEINAEGNMMVTVEHGKRKVILGLKDIFQEL